MNDRFKKVKVLANTHPGSFEYAWMTAAPEVRLKYMEMFDRLADLDGEDEMRFLVWMAGQDEDTRRSFMAIVGRGLR